MEITEACRTVHQWQELFAPGATATTTPASLPKAIATLKSYLEREKADGKSIHELLIADHLLMTREGVQWVMPFVLSAESMEAAKRRKAAR